MFNACMHGYPTDHCLIFFGLSLLQLRDVSTATGKQAESRKKRMNKVVKRVVFLMCAYAAITALTYAPICALQQHSKLLEYYIKQYFVCLMFQPPEQCPRSKYFCQNLQKGFYFVHRAMIGHYNESSDCLKFPKGFFVAVMFLKR